MDEHTLACFLLCALFMCMRELGARRVTAMRQAMPEWQDEDADDDFDSFDDEDE